MPTPSTRSAWNGSRAAVTSPDASAAGQKRLPGPREPEALVGREDARVQADDQHAHAGADRVGEHVGSGRLDVDPLLAVVACSTAPRSPAPSTISRNSAVVKCVKCRPVKGSFPSAGSWSHVTWRCTAPPSATARCKLGERHRHPLRRHVHVRLVRPRAAERAAPERQPLEVALDPPRVRRELADALEHRERGVERDDRVPSAALCQPGPLPRSPRTPAVSRADERRQRCREPAVASARSRRPRSPRRRRRSRDPFGGASRMEARADGADWRAWHSRVSSESSRTYRPTSPISW